MARIRSVHPGLFTDEAFVSLSDAAQIFLVGLWTECDDQGAFEWKPVTLRMKLRPNRDGSVEPLMAELEAANCIMSYEHGGRKLGLVRNFTKYQRPKKPNSVHFIPPQFRTYASPDKASGEPEVDEPGPVPPKGEMSPQMEDGGGIEGGRKVGLCSARESSERLEQQMREAAGWQNEIAPMLAVTGEVEALMANGAILETDVLPVVRALAPKARSRKSWKFFIPAITQARDDRVAALTAVSPPNQGLNHGTHRQSNSSGHGPQRSNSITDSIAVVRAALVQRIADERGEGAGGAGPLDEDAANLPGLRQNHAADHGRSERKVG